MQLARWLDDARRELGDDDALVRAMLAGRTPVAAADALVSGSQLEQTATRRTLLDGGTLAIDRSGDPVIVAVRAIEEQSAGYARRTAQLGSVLSASGGLLGEAIYAAYGEALPPTRHSRSGSATAW